MRYQGKNLGEAVLQRFVLLDVMRFVMALLVAMAHFNGFASPPKAYLAVDFFFILSGFVLSLAYCGKCTDQDFLKKFTIDRIARLYPLHLATLLFLVPLNVLFYVTTNGQLLENGWAYGDGRVYMFVLNLFMLQSVGLNTQGAWNAPAWSISVEMVVNLIMALALPAIANNRRAWPFVLGFSILCYALLFIAFDDLKVISEKAFGFMNAGLLRGFAGISLGCLCFIAYRWLESEARPWLRPVAIITAFIAVGLLAFPVSAPKFDFLMIPVMSVAVLSLSLHERSAPVVHGRAFLAELGALSYAVYLCHWPILIFARYQLSYAWKLPIDFNAPSSLIVFLAVVLASAFLSFRYFEMPAKRMVKQWLTGRRTAGRPASAR